MANPHRLDLAIPGFSHLYNHSFYYQERNEEEEMSLTKGQAIKNYCKNRCDGRTCEDKNCELYPWRKGEDPKKKGMMKNMSRNLDGTFKKSA